MPYRALPLPLPCPKTRLSSVIPPGSPSAPSVPLWAPLQPPVCCVLCVPFRYTMKNMSNLLWGFARMEFYNKPLFDAVAERVSNMLEVGWNACGGLNVAGGEQALPMKVLL